MNWPESYGPIERHPHDQHELFPLLSPMGWMQLSQRRQACPQPGQSSRARETKFKNLKDTQIGRTKQERMQLSKWHPISKELLPITTERPDHVPLGLGLQSSKGSFRTRLKKEPKNSKQTKKDPTLYLRLETQGFTICECWAKYPCSAIGMYPT